MIDYREIARPGRPPLDYAADEPMRLPSKPRFRFAAGPHWIGAACVASIGAWVLIIYGLMILGHYLGWLS